MCICFTSVGNMEKSLMYLILLVSGLCEQKKNANISRIFCTNSKEELRLRNENPASFWCEAAVLNTVQL